MQKKYKRRHQASFNQGILSSSVESINAFEGGEGAGVLGHSIDLGILSEK